MADTTRALIHNVLRYFHHSHRPERNRLAEALDASETDITFAFDLRGIKDGAKVSVDLEDCYVWSVSEASKTATVERGDFGSAAATHADATVVYVNPVVSFFDVLAALNDELNLLGSPRFGLFAKKTDTFTFQPASFGFDLAADVLDVIDVEYEAPGDDWYPIGRDQWKFEANADPTDFPSGKSLSLYSGGFAGRTVRVTYKGPFSTLATLADVPATVSGLLARAHPIIEMGAALRLASARPMRRSDLSSQGDPRRAEEVSVADALQAPGRLASLREEAIAAEATRLAQEYGA